MDNKAIRQLHDLMKKNNPRKAWSDLYEAVRTGDFERVKLKTQHKAILRWMSENDHILSYKEIEDALFDGLCTIPARYGIRKDHLQIHLNHLVEQHYLYYGPFKLDKRKSGGRREWFSRKRFAVTRLGFAYLQE